MKTGLVSVLCRAWYLALMEKVPESIKYTNVLCSPEVQKQTPALAFYNHYNCNPGWLKYTENFVFAV